MAQVSYPGVYIEEVPGAPAPVQGASPSSLALVGWTDRGPVNEPTIVTGFKEFERTFGGFTSAGLVPTCLHAFFKNGGSVAYIARVAPADADTSVAYFSDPVADEDTGVDGDNSDTTISFTLDGLPVPGSFTHSHWRRATAITGATTVTTAPNGTIVIWKTSGAGGGEGVFIVPVGMEDGIEPGSVTITWTSGAASKSQTDNGTGGFTGDGTPGSSSIDYLTGAVVFNATGAIPDAGTASTITIGYRPLVHNTDGEDDGAGAITGTNIASGTIDYETGEVAITYTVAPSLKYPLAASGPTQSLLASYSSVLWRLDMAWPGLAGDDFSVVLLGTTGTEDDDAATFTAWTLRVLDGGTVVEQFSGLNFDDATSAKFFPTVVNDPKAGSAYVVVTDVGATGVPATLSGSAVTAEAQTVSPSVDSSVKAFTFTLGSESCHQTTLTITATAADDSTMTVTDDGSGNLVGDVLASGANTVDYETGEVDVTFDLAPKTGSTVYATYYSAASASTVTVAMAGGSDGSALTSTDIVGAAHEAPMEGLYALNKTDVLLMVAVPDFAGDATVDQALVDYATERMDRFAILTTPRATEYADAILHKRRTLARNSSSYAAMYWPWVQIVDPVTSTAVYVPPVGHVAGVYARTDATRNVAKSPAGVEDGALRFATGLEFSPTNTQVGLLNQVGVNALVDWPQVGGPTVWGARTIEVNGEFTYVPVRRLFMFLEKSVFNAAQKYVFEPNGSSLWARIKMEIGGFLSLLYSQGYFAGTSEESAYFLVVDSTNNPQASIDAGLLYVDIGVAPLKPAEFIVFRFQQKLAE